MLFGILEDPHLGGAKHQPVVVVQLNLGHKFIFYLNIFLYFIYTNIFICGAAQPRAQIFF